MNNVSGVSRAEQYRALGLSTLAFTLCFAVWTIFSILGISIKQDLGLSDTQLGLLMATPILSGSISRIFLGIITDRVGGRWVFGSLMLLSAVCVYLLSLANSYAMLLLAALGVGLAGGSFIVGVAYTSAWYEQGKQGTALGIFGAGNVGSALTNFGAPFLLLLFVRLRCLCRIGLVVAALFDGSLRLDDCGRWYCNRAVHRACLSVSYSWRLAIR